MPTLYDLPLPGNTAMARSQELTQLIQNKISHAPISFAEYMEFALYHPKLGYYMKDAIEIGARGDFTTAPEISSLFAKCLSRQVIQVLAEIADSSILELGAGTGKLAADVLLELQAQNSLPRYYYIFEISPALKAKQFLHLKTALPGFIDRIVWLENLPTEFTGVIIANEVLDALPTHLFSVDNEEVYEKKVGLENNSFCWVQSELSKELKVSLLPILTKYEMKNSYESEMNLAVHRLLENLLQCLARGVALILDYGYGEEEYYHPERNRGTLTCFYQHRKTSDPFIYPGLQDITSHVNFTQVINHAADYGGRLAGFTTQANFLLACGLLELLERESQTLSAVEQYNLNQKIKLLTLPTEMGEVIKVMAIEKNIELSLLGFRNSNRIREL